MLFASVIVNAPMIFPPTAPLIVTLPVVPAVRDKFCAPGTVINRRRKEDVAAAVGEGPVGCVDCYGASEDDRSLQTDRTVERHDADGRAVSQG